MTIYGRKLSKKEYEALIVNLFENSKNIKGEYLKEAELNLNIDHRLGLYFPIDRRKKIWEIYSRTNGKISKKIASSLIFNILPNKLKNYLWANFIHSMEKDFLSVLSKSELQDLFGIEK